MDNISFDDFLREQLQDPEFAVDYLTSVLKHGSTSDIAAAREAIRAATSPSYFTNDNEIKDSIDDTEYSNDGNTDILSNDVLIESEERNEHEPAKESQRSRPSISKRTRFEIFKRDSFTCQYCGSKSPDVLLEIDHILPFSKGGTSDFLNLITSCQACNNGKSNNLISDDSIIEKQRKQLEALQARREQIEMMMQWQRSLLQLDDDILSQLSSYWSELAPGYSLNENGMIALKKLRLKSEPDDIMGAMHTAATVYLERINGKLTQESVETALTKLGGILEVTRREKTEPHIRRLYYIRGILKNRISYVNEAIVMNLLREAIASGATPDMLEDHAKKVTSWSQWREAIELFIQEQSIAENHENDRVEGSG